MEHGACHISTFAIRLRDLCPLQAHMMDVQKSEDASGSDKPNPTLIDLGTFFVDSDIIFGFTSHLLRRKAKVSASRPLYKLVAFSMRAYAGVATSVSTENSALFPSLSHLLKNIRLTLSSSRNVLSREILSKIATKKNPLLGNKFCKWLW